MNVFYEEEQQIGKFVERKISAAVLVKGPCLHLDGQQLLHPLEYMHYFSQVYVKIADCGF